MNISDIYRLQRAILWEEAKGKLRAMMETYRSPECSTDQEFDDTFTAVKEFIKYIEDSRS